MTTDEIEQVKEAIAALEAQRPVLGDAVVETALAPLREKLAALTRAAPQVDERKRITILFSDLAGFTATSETMDPEEVHSIMDAYFAHMNPAITRYGGAIEKYIGDAVMALFGAPKALEKHEEMAVRAALDMHAALQEFNEEMERKHGIRLAMRIGVNTGLVLFGAMGGRADTDFAAVGDAINLTSRLESAAPVGGILISAETARPLHAIFDFEPPQQITVKGKREPITVYSVIGEKAKRGRVRGVKGLHAPLVGREEELSALQSTFESTLRQNRWQAVALVGEAGVGKSRLQREFVAWLAETDPQIHVLTGRCYAHTQATPYHLMAELMRGLFNLGSDASPDAALAQLSEALRLLDPHAEEEFRYRLGSLASVLGLPMEDDPLQRLEPEQRRDRTFLSLERLLMAVSSAAPLLVIIEDLHWADALSLSFVERILQTVARGDISDRTALLLTDSRPAEEPESPLARVLEQMAQPPHQTLKLSLLNLQHTGALVSELIGEAALPENLVSRILEQTQGNPFFVEEVIRSLIEDGTLIHDPESDEWQVTQAEADIEVPDTVQSVLAARIDRLPTDDKHIVRRAAIVGHKFWQRLLADTSAGGGGIKGLAVESILSRLEQRQLVRRSSESQIAEDWEWLFRHVLAQEVAYASVTRETRRQVHARVARWLEAHAEEQTSSLIPMIAYHYERGGVAGKAAEYLQRAGEQAAAQFANENAVDYFSRALALLEQAEQEPAQVQERRYALLLGREGVYGLMGFRDLQATDLADLKALADEMDDDQHKAETALRYADYYEAISDFPTALKAAQEAVQRAEQVTDQHRKSEGLIAWAQALWRQGDIEDARRRLEEALNLAHQHSDDPAEAKCMHHLGTISYIQGNYEAARDYLERALTIRHALGNPLREASTLNNLVAVYHGLGDLGRAEECCECALDIHRAIGYRWGEAHALDNLAAIRCALGDLVTAREEHRRALALFQMLSDRRSEARAAKNLGLILRDLGDNQAAQRYCEEALQMDRAIGNRKGEGYSLTYLALAQESLGELGDASKAYEEALRLRCEIGQDALAIDDLAGLARVALEQDRVAQALAHVEEALDWIGIHGVQGIEYPLRVYLTSADVLAAAGQEERAAEILATAYDLLQEQAARISDEDTRRAFLENVPLHQQLRSRISQGACAKLGGV